MTLPLAEMMKGKDITIYGQRYLLQDLIRNRLKSRRYVSNNPIPIHTFTFVDMINRHGKKFIVILSVVVMVRIGIVVEHQL